MKKGVAIFLLFIISITAFFIYKSYNKPYSKFISISDKTFIKDGEPFYPLTINYIVGLYTDGETLWPSPSVDYKINSGDLLLNSKKESAYNLYADFTLIKELGFNSIRIISIGCVDVVKQKDTLNIKAKQINNSDTIIFLSNEKTYQQYFNAISDLLQIIDSAGLKAILLTKTLVDEKKTEKHLEKLTNRFKDNTALMGYDLFNEPLYFDTKAREKKEIYYAVKRWQSIVKKNAPNHLTTIGLEGVREVFRWDPGILDVDFISFHPYEYEPEQVRNEIYWYGKYIKKPWIIGETAIPADNDSVKYETQKLFAEKTLKQAYDCGASGYSWWQYKDVEWFKYHANYMGLVTLPGKTKTKNGIAVFGAVKSTGEAFKNFSSMAKKGDCLCLENYYNYSKGDACKLTGKIIDDKGEPIEGAVVLAWNKDWSKSYHTISKKDGTIELLGTFFFYNWTASAIEYSKVDGWLEPEKVENEIRPLTIDIGEIKLSRLSF